MKVGRQKFIHGWIALGEYWTCIPLRLQKVWKRIQERPAALTFFQQRNAVLQQRSEWEQNFFLHQILWRKYQVLRPKNRKFPSKRRRDRPAAQTVHFSYCEYEISYTEWWIFCSGESWPTMKIYTWLDSFGWVLNVCTTQTSKSMRTSPAETSSANFYQAAERCAATA